MSDLNDHGIFDNGLGIEPVEQMKGRLSIRIHCGFRPKAKLEYDRTQDKHLVHGKARDRFVALEHFYQLAGRDRLLRIRSSLGGRCEGGEHWIVRPGEKHAKAFKSPL